MKVRLIAEDGEIYEWRNVETIEEGFDTIFLFPPREREQCLFLYHSESLIDEMEKVKTTTDYVALNSSDHHIERIEVSFENKVNLDFIGNNLAQDTAKQEAKLKLNSLYGRMVSKYYDTDSCKQ